MARRGLKRAQEAVRVLEEFARAGQPEASEALAQVRFELYAAEQWLDHGAGRAAILQGARLYVLLAEADCPLGLEATAQAVLEGGARIVQVREKALEGAALLERVKRVKALCAQHEALCVVNDRTDVALAAEADGVHLGQRDLEPRDARRLAGEGLVIGRSTHSAAQARRAVDEEGADYVGIGALYPTGTKQAIELIGPAGARAVAELDLKAPVFAIGGITVERIHEVRAAGLTRIAVSKAVCAARDPARAAKELLERLLN